MRSTCALPPEPGRLPEMDLDAVLVAVVDVPALVALPDTAADRVLVRRRVAQTPAFVAEPAPGGADCSGGAVSPRARGPVDRAALVRLVHAAVDEAADLI